ncbi:WXG100-like domain-containing protein [Saccharopolyspora sp. NPDC000995]
MRRLFQVLTGEDMTDADEGVLFAVADALESGAAGVGEMGGLVAELVAKVRTEFSGKAADRFAGGLEVFDGLLASGERELRELAVFVRDLARQVRYLKLVTIHSLEILLLEMAWAVYWAGATGGGSMAWLAARMAVMRFLLSRWWGQLFMRLAMAAAGGVAFNVVPDLQAQVQMLGEKSAQKWDGKLSEQSAGMGAFSALVSLPLSAVGGLVSNALTKVLVRGLGDEVDEKILEAAAKKAVAEHAEKYPVSAMARFADVVGKSLDIYAGMSVRGMWSARFGRGVGRRWRTRCRSCSGRWGISRRRDRW